MNAAGVWNDAFARVAAWRPHAAVVFGSGLEALPPGVVLDGEIGYDALGWPCTGVPGHANRLQLARVATAGGRELRLALACGRPHAYEGFEDAELSRPVRDLVRAGAGAVMLTNSTGALRPAVDVGALVVCTGVVDLQRPPEEAAPRALPVCTAEQAAAVAAAVRAASSAACAAPSPAAGTVAPCAAPAADVHTGVYVAVSGPQFETPAEVAWLAGYGAVVGMSAAPEVRAAHRVGAGCCLLALVVNRAAEIGSHEDVLARGGNLAESLARALVPALLARWPDLI